MIDPNGHGWVWVRGEVTGVQEPAEQAVLNRKAGEIGKGRGGRLSYRQLFPWCGCGCSRGKFT